MTCDHCGFTALNNSYDQQSASAKTCERCGVVFRAFRPVPQMAVAAAAAAPVPLTAPAYPATPPTSSHPATSLQADKWYRYRFSFSGTGEEFFRIWIVNIFLTVITLGIYNAWAKVRTRRYFYANTRVAKHAFDYLADPKAILVGNLIVGGALIAYNTLGQLRPLIGLGMLAVGALVFPWLVWKSLRFKARYSSYRGVRFVFHGGLAESYVCFLLLPLLSAVTLGLAFPYTAYRQKRYFFGHMAFGLTRNSFDALWQRFFSAYLKAFLIVLGPVVLVAILAAAMFTQAIGGNTGAAALTIIAFYLGYFLLLASSNVAQTYAFVQLTNYSWEHSKLGQVRFQSTLAFWPMVGIRLSNLALIAFTGGLAIPWAMVRNARYVLENLAVVTKGDLSEFSAATKQDEDALGEVAADVFDFEVAF